MPVETGRASWLMAATVYKDVASSPPWGRVRLTGTKKTHTTHLFSFSVVCFDSGTLGTVSTDSSLLI